MKALEGSGEKKVTVQTACYIVAATKCDFYSNQNYTCVINGFGSKDDCENADKKIESTSIRLKEAHEDKIDELLDYINDWWMARIKADETDNDSNIDLKDMKEINKPTEVDP